MINFATVGTNWITDRFIDAGKRIEGFHLAGIYSRSKSRALDYASLHNAELIFTDLQELAQSAEVDAVYIASPNALHCEQAMTLMAHGKHVICEKPMAVNVNETRRMIECAKDNGVVLMEALKSTLSPDFCKFREELHRVGTIRRFFVNLSKYSSRYDRYLNGEVPNAFNPKLGNGALMDLGPYCIYPSVILFGRPNQVMAHSVFLESGVDGLSTVTLAYEGFQVIIAVSKINDSQAKSEIQGEKGSLVVDKIGSFRGIHLHERNGDRLTISEGSSEPVMKYEIEEMMHLIQSYATESSMNTHAASLMTAEILEEVRRQTGFNF